MVQLLEDKVKLASSPQMVADLQSLAGALLETVNDKNMALSHQRKTNRLAGDFKDKIIQVRNYKTECRVCTLY